MKFGQLLKTQKFYPPKIRNLFSENEAVRPIPDFSLFFKKKKKLFIR